MKAAVSYTGNRKRALRMGVHIVILRQFIGGNVLVTFSGQIMQAFSPGGTEYLRYTPLFVNGLQLISNFFAVSYITKILGRRPLFIFGTAALTLFDLALALVLYFS